MVDSLLGRHVGSNDDNDLEIALAESLLISCFCGGKFSGKEELQLHQLLCPALPPKISHSEDVKRAVDSEDKHEDALTPDDVLTPEMCNLEPESALVGSHERYGVILPVVSECNAEMSEQVVGTDGESRSVVRVAYTLKQDLALCKKRAACDRYLYKVKENKSSTTVTLNTMAFEYFRRVIVNYLRGRCYRVSEPKPVVDRAGSVTGDIIRVLRKDGFPMCTINLYRPSSRIMINGPCYANFSSMELPLILAELDKNADLLKEASDQTKQSITHNILQTRLKTGKNSNEPTTNKGYPERSKNTAILDQQVSNLGVESNSAVDTDKLDIAVETETANPALISPRENAPVDIDNDSIVECLSYLADETAKSSADAVDVLVKEPTTFVETSQLDGSPNDDGCLPPTEDLVPHLSKRLSKKSSRLLSYEKSRENRSKRPKKCEISEMNNCEDKEDLSLESEGEDLFCVCQVPWRKDEGDTMTYCEKCCTWLHYKCAGVSKEKLKDIQHFICFQCAMELYVSHADLRSALIKSNEIKTRGEEANKTLSVELEEQVKLNKQLSSKISAIEKNLAAEKKGAEKLQSESAKNSEKIKNLQNQQSNLLKHKQDNETLKAHQDTLRGTILSYEETITLQKKQIIDLEIKISAQENQIQALELDNATHKKFGEAMIDNVVNTMSVTVTDTSSADMAGGGAGGAQCNDHTKKKKTPADKEVNKEVKNLSSKVKDLEERCLRLTIENDELRTQKNNLELDVQREKQITNMHLSLTSQLSAAKDELKNLYDKEKTMSQYAHHQNHSMEHCTPSQKSQRKNSQGIPQLHHKSCDSSDEKKFLREMHLNDLRTAYEQEKLSHETEKGNAIKGKATAPNDLEQHSLIPQSIHINSRSVDRSGNQTSVTAVNDTEPALAPGASVSGGVSKFHPRSPRLIPPQDVALQQNLNNQERVPRVPVQYIKEEDIRKICFHELFAQQSCRRSGCSFSHDFPPEFRTCEPLISRVKSIQAQIKKRKQRGGLVNRF